MTIGSRSGAAVGLDARPRRLGVGQWFDGHRLHRGDIELTGDLITAVGLPAGGDGIACPGYIDLQINGFRGTDALTTDVHGVATIASQLPATGVVAFALTLITAEVDDIDRSLAHITDVRAAQREEHLRTGARLLGAHLEGPFLSRAFPGAHPVELLRDADAGLVNHWISTGALVMVTMAPEISGGFDAVDAFSSNGIVVSLGHCDATGLQANAAFDRGARALTHGLNAHRPLSARDPGPLGVALTRADIVTTVIADGVHLDSANLLLLQRAAPGRIALVTDGIVASGLGDGVFQYGPLTVTVAEGRATLPSGRLAGSVATMDSSVRLAAACWGVEAALAAATSVPAELLGRPDLGRLGVGETGDLVILNDRLNVCRTLCAGQTLYEVADA